MLFWDEHDVNKLSNKLFDSFGIAKVCDFNSLKTFYFALIHIFWNFPRKKKNIDKVLSVTKNVLILSHTT